MVYCPGVRAPVDRSFHVLEISVQPGGARFAELHVDPDPAQLRPALAGFCANSDGLSAYLAIWYGARIGVWTVQAGVVTGFVDAYPHIAVHLDDRPPIPLTDDDALRALILAVREQKLREEDDEVDEYDLQADYHDLDMETYEAMRLVVDWPAIAATLPALTPPLLQPRELAVVRHDAPPRDTYLKTGTIRLGAHEHETGARHDEDEDYDDEEEDDDEAEADET